MDRPPTHPIVPDFPADAFAGTAEYYARYRVPYPKALTDALRVQAGITGGGRLLDLACGTGHVALALSPFFREVWAVDQEPEMVEVGRRTAEAQSAGNVVWKTERAEDLQASPGTFELITIGNAFHRLHRRLIGQKALDWLLSGRCLAVLGSSSHWTGGEDWQAIVRGVIRKWTGKGPIGEGSASDQPRETFEEALRFAGFHVTGEQLFPVQHLWSLDAFVGYVYSLSVASRKLLGDRAADFEAELRQSLLAFDAQGQYRETIEFFLILARKPLA